jgi:hypothetical protein
MDEDCQLAIFNHEVFVLIDQDRRHEGRRGIPPLLGGRTIAQLLHIGVVDDRTWSLLQSLQPRTRFLGKERSTSERRGSL